MQNQNIILLEKTKNHLVRRLSRLEQELEDINKKLEKIQKRK